MITVNQINNVTCTVEKTKVLMPVTLARFYGDGTTTMAVEFNCLEHREIAVSFERIDQDEGHP